MKDNSLNRQIPEDSLTKNIKVKTLLDCIQLSLTKHIKVKSLLDCIQLSLANNIKVKSLLDCILLYWSYDHLQSRVDDLN